MAGRQCRGDGARGKGSRRCRTGILPRGAAARLPGSLRRAGNAHRSRLHPDRGTQGDGRCTRPRRHSPADESRAGDAAGERSRQDRDPGRGLLRERGAVHLPCREIRRRRGDGMDRRPSRHHASGRSLSRLPCHGRDGLHGARRCEDRGGTARRIRPVEDPVRRVAQLGAGRD